MCVCAGQFCLSAFVIFRPLFLILACQLGIGQHHLCGIFPFDPPLSCRADGPERRPSAISIDYRNCCAGGQYRLAICYICTRTVILLGRPHFSSPRELLFFLARPPPPPCFSSTGIDLLAATTSVINTYGTQQCAAQRLLHGGQS